MDRKTTERKTIYVPQAAVSVCGGVQPSILRRILSAEYFDCGLAARLLFAMPDPRPARWSKREISDATLNAIDSMYGNLFALKGATDVDGDPMPADVALADDAQERFIQYVNEHAEKAVALHGADAAAWSKLKGYAAWFALIHHLVRQAGGEDVDPWNADLASVEAGIGLADWFWAECQRVYRSFSESAEDRERRELLDLIYKLGGQVTPRQIRDVSRWYREPGTADAALEGLVSEGMGAWQVVRQDGKKRPTTAFVLADSPDYPARSAPINQNSNGKSHCVDRTAGGPGDNGNGHRQQAGAQDSGDRPPNDPEWAAALVKETEKRGQDASDPLTADEQ